MIDINAHYLIAYEEEGTRFIGPFPTAEQANDHPVSRLFDKRVVSGEWLKAACATLDVATEEVRSLIESPERHLAERDRFFEMVQMSDEEAEYCRAHPQEMRIDQINFRPDTTEEIQLYKEIIRVGPRQKTRQSCLEEAAGESPRRLHCFAGNILKVAAKEACYSVSGALFSQRRATCLKGGCCPNVGGESHDL